MQTYIGEHLEILYERSGPRALIRAVRPFERTYLLSGVAHLVADVHGLLARLSSEGVREVKALPDRSATRTTLEEAGFRGEGVMRYEPASPRPTPVLDAGRPGAFGPDTPVLLEEGRTVPAGALHPGVRLAEGGRVEEVMLARVRRVCRLDGHLYGALNRVRVGAGARPVTDLEGGALEETSGTELVWLVTQRSRVRSGGYLFEDMWGSAALRETRRISQAEVIAALNAADRS